MLFVCDDIVNGCRGLRPKSTATGVSSISSDQRYMAIAVLQQQRSVDEGDLTASLVAAASDATLQMLHFDTLSNR